MVIEHLHLRGDFFVVRTNGIIGWLIRVVTRSPYNHAGIFLTDSPDLDVVEARMIGATQDRPDYSKCRMLVSDVLLTDAERLAICTQAHQFVTKKIGYGWLDILSVGLLQYGIRPGWVRARVKHSDRLICSQLVDAAYLFSRIHLFDDGRLPMDVTPGDLAVLIEHASAVPKT